MMINHDSSIQGQMFRILNELNISMEFWEIIKKTRKKKGEERVGRMEGGKGGRRKTLRKKINEIRISPERKLRVHLGLLQGLSENLGNF